MSAVTYALERARTRRRGRKHLTRRFESAGPLTYLFLLLVIALSIFPLYWSLVVASHTDAAIGAYPPVVTPGGNLFHNIGKVFDSGQVNVDFLKAMGRSAIVASVVTVSVVFFSALAGFAFAKLKFRGSKLLLLVVIATTIIPVQLGVIPLYIEMIHFHWLFNLKAVIIPNLATAFGVFLMRQYIAGGVPDELIDSARVDGCNTLRVFWHVILPAVRPVAAVLGLLTFMNTWNDFFWPLVVLGNRAPTVQVAVSAVAGNNFIPDYSLILAATFVSILPLLFVFLVLGKQIIGGIMQGAVKG